MIGLNKYSCDKMPVIIVVTYNRVEALKRLLSSLSNAYYREDENVKLVISIDGGASENVLSHAKDFEWKHGEKEVKYHTENLGLRKHIIQCGDLSAVYGDIIILEDDCFVAADFYNYTVQALDFYRNDSSIAGISLYSYSTNEYAQLPFTPVLNEYDNYFMQVPSSWGQAWTPEQWRGFKSFYDTNPRIGSNDPLPEAVKAWPESSWKKYFYKYLVDKNLYFVYPVHSQTTNFSEAGVHVLDEISFLQVSMFNPSGGFQYTFSSISDSVNIYDAYFEPLISCLSKMGVNLEGDVAIDFYGTKQLSLIENKYLLSIKDCTSPIKKYGCKMIPFFQNVKYSVPGSVIKYAPTNDFSIVQHKTKETIASNTDYFSFWIGYKSGLIDGINKVRSSRTYRLTRGLVKPFSVIIKMLRK